MTQHEEVAGGGLGKLAGKLKEVAGSVFGHDDLAREGRLQSAHVDAETEAGRRAAEVEQAEQEVEVVEAKDEIEIERRRLQTELAADAREVQAEQQAQRAKVQAEADARKREQAVEAAEQAVERAADGAERQAAENRLADARDVARLEQEARRAQAVADALDPEETR